MVTKRTFIAVAAVIKTQLDRSSLYVERSLLRRVVFDLASKFKQDNPAFDRARFEEACFPYGLDEGGVPKPKEGQ